MTQININTFPYLKYIQRLFLYILVLMYIFILCNIPVRNGIIERWCDCELNGTIPLYVWSYTWLYYYYRQVTCVLSTDDRMSEMYNVIFTVKISSLY